MKQATINSPKTIHIYHSLIDNAISEEASKFNSEDGSRLFTILLEEYGHYIDDVLRNQFSNVKGDAKKDEGSVFANNIARRS